MCETAEVHSNPLDMDDKTTVVHRRGLGIDEPGVAEPLSGSPGPRRRAISIAGEDALGARLSVGTGSQIEKIVAVLQLGKGGSYHWIGTVLEQPPRWKTCRYTFGLWAVSQSLLPPLVAAIDVQ